MFVRIVVAAAVALLLVGCGAYNATPATSLSARPPGLTLDSPTVNALRPLPADVDAAWQRAVAACMNGQGVKYAMLASNRSLANSSLLGVRGFFDVQSASTDGYGFFAPRPLSSATETESFRHAWGGASPTTVTASGDSGDMSITTSGCQGTASLAIYGDLQTAVRQMVTQNDFRIATNNGIGPDDEQAMAAPLAAYVACMTKHGHDVASPDAAQDYARTEFLRDDPAQSATPSELAFAVDDAKCQSSAHYLDATDRIALDAASDWIATHKDAIADLAQWRDATIARAAATP